MKDKYDLDEILTEMLEDDSVDGEQAGAKLTQKDIQRLIIQRREKGRNQNERKSPVQKTAD